MLGMIGCGNMAQAMLKGILDANIYKADDVIVSRRNEEALQDIKKEFGINTTTDNVTVARTADVLMLCVKPAQFADVIDQLRDEVADDVLIISIAAGQTIENIKNLFRKDVKVVRTMPNTPALVGEGATGMCLSENIGSEDADRAKKIFESFGTVVSVPESLMDVVVGVSGSSPAYIFMLIEAMADAAVAEGMPRADAYKLAAQSVLGSAKLVLETGEHPGALKDKVCSPGGTTAAGVRALEENGFRGTVMQGIIAAVDRSREMSNN